MTATQGLATAEAPVATAAMLVRRPVAEVFEAFVDPAITSKFWFSGGSGRLAPGARVRWEWAMYGFSVGARVVAFERDARIVVEWGDDEPTTVEWRFTPHGADATFVEIANSGFHGDTAAVVAQAIDSAGGFSFVLAGLKAWLEHGIELKLVADRHPQGFGGMSAERV